MLELLLVIFILSIIASVLFFAFVRLGFHQTLEQEAATARAFLEEARIHTQSSRLASSHGVLFSEDGITLFRGPSWDDREEILKEHRFDSSVRVTSINFADDSDEVVFTRLFGEPTTIGKIELSSLRNDSQRSIAVTASGFIE